MPKHIVARSDSNMIARTMLLERNTNKLSELPGSPWDPSFHQRSLPYPFYLSKIMTNDEANKNRIRNDALAKGGEEIKPAIELNLGKPENGPSFILMTGQTTLASSSSLTDSEISSRQTESTESSSKGSYTEPTKPPRIIKVANPLVPTTLPYAQLCFDPETKTLVTLMEINLAGNGRRSKRLRIVDPQDEKEPESMVPMAPLSNAGTESTVSSRSNGDEIPKYDEPIILSSETQEVWLEETDLLDLYLLHDFDDPWDVEVRGGCADTLRKLVTASRSLIVFKQRDSRWETTREPFSGIGYTVLEEV
jgi:hypothetical protein